jgi:NADH:ubiquinone oxidoreductase subunit K
MAVGLAESVVAVMMAESVVAVVMAESVVAVGMAESVVAVVMVVTRTRNSKELDVKPALDTTMQTRIQQCKY